MAGQAISARPNKFIPICICIGVVCVAICLVLASPRHKTHSGGDYGVPTFANGGQYADGTRKASFNCNNHRAYGSSQPQMSSNFIVFIAVILLVAFVLRNCQSVGNCGAQCNGGCCQT